MKAREHIAALQEALGIPAEKRAPHIGPLTRAAFERLAKLNPDDEFEESPVDSVIHSVKASSFADPADVRAFRRCKAQGKSDQECFKVGDNGIGKWGDDTTGDKPMVALPPEDWKPFGASARGKKVIVNANGRSVLAELRDTMPARKNIRNGAGIDLNPAACAALGLRPPIMVSATWQWA